MIIQGIKTDQKSINKKIVGAAILLVGIVLLAKQFGFWMPKWLISWPMLLIIIGLANGFKHKFRNLAWLIVTLIGLLFLLEKINSHLSVVKYTWPIILIGAGLWFLFGRKSDQNPFGKKNKFEKNSGSYNQNENFKTSSLKKNEPLIDHQAFKSRGDDYLESVAVFGGAKRSVFSKNFKGGEITSIFGGNKVNLSHADIDGIVVIEATQIFGGTKIIVPPTWDVVSEISPLFGGVNDNRSLAHVLPDKSKLLLIKGTTIFGGIKIRNF